MMFRRLYWVTEEIEPSGHSQVTGVYTSIPDLIRHGLRSGEGEQNGNIRLTLTKLDSTKPPLGCWQAPAYDGLAESLQEYVKTDEFSEEHCKLLVQELSRLNKVAV